MLENISSFEDCLSSQLKLDIYEHFHSLEREFQKYFLNLAKGDEIFVRNPFSILIEITTNADQIQDELLDLKNDSSARDLFQQKSLT